MKAAAPEMQLHETTAATPEKPSRGPDRVCVDRESHSLYEKRAAAPETHLCETTAAARESNCLCETTAPPLARELQGLYKKKAAAPETPAPLARQLRSLYKKEHAAPVMHLRETLRPSLAPCAHPVGSWPSSSVAPSAEPVFRCQHVVRRAMAGALVLV